MSRRSVSAPRWRSGTRVEDEMTIDRRMFLSSAAAVAAGSALPVHAAAPTRTLPAPFDDIERRTFDYFWERTNKANGLVPDRWPTPSFASIAAVGFGLTAWPLAWTAAGSRANRRAT